MSITKCQCDEPGFCKLLQREMQLVRWEECKNKPGYFEVFLREHQTGSYDQERKAAQSNLHGGKQTDYTLCSHRGEEIDRRECDSCEGTVKIKIFDCKIHKECSLAMVFDTMACCLRCGDNTSLTEKEE